MDAFTYKDLQIIYEDNHLLVVDKPVNIPMQEDSSHDIDLLSLTKTYLKETYHKPGEVYSGLVQRLDRPVGGVCVFAKTSKAASRLSDQIRRKSFHKEYHAVLCGIADAEGILLDFLLKDKNTNMVKVVSSETNGAKEARLQYQLLEVRDKHSLVKINLETGRSHQIRVQFASRELPIWGDQRYNKNALVGQQIALWASRITFIHPVRKEEVSFKSTLPQRDIWKLFEVEK